MGAGTFSSGIGIGVAYICDVPMVAVELMITCAMLLIATTMVLVWPRGNTPHRQHFYRQTIPEPEERAGEGL